MYNIKQDVGSDMMVLNKIFDMLDYVGARVISIEKTPLGERYSVSYGKDIAYVYMTNTGAVINIYCDGNMVLRRIVSVKDAGVRDTLVSLQEKLAARSKICQSKIKESSEDMLNLQLEILRINRKIHKISKPKQK